MAVFNRKNDIWYPVWFIPSVNRNFSWFRHTFETKNALRIHLRNLQRISFNFDFCAHIRRNESTLDPSWFFIIRIHFAIEIYRQWSRCLAFMFQVNFLDLLPFCKRRKINHCLSDDIEDLGVFVHGYDGDALLHTNVHLNLLMPFVVFIV